MYIKGRHACIYIYIYIYTHNYTCACVYVYVYIHTCIEKIMSRSMFIDIFINKFVCHIIHIIMIS